MRRSLASYPRPHVNSVRAICARLERRYGSPRLGNPTGPLDDLVYIIASNRTGPIVANRTFAALRQRYPRWDLVTPANEAALLAILRPAGLALKRANHILSIFHRLRRDFGSVTLDPLMHRSDD